MNLNVIFLNTSYVWNTLVKHVQFSPVKNIQSIWIQYFGNLKFRRNNSTRPLHY